MNCGNPISRRSISGLNAIRAEEALATPDHSEVAMERWDHGTLAGQDAQERAKGARDEYKDALRRVNYGF